MKFFFSMLTACTCGVAIAFGGILLGKYTVARIAPQSSNSSSAAVLNTTLSATEDTSLNEEADQDGTFISKFSRVSVYSSDVGKEIIESAKNSLPKTHTSKVTASAYVVIDLDRNVVLIEKDAEKLLPIASVTKLVTAIVAKKLLDKNASITMTQKMLSTYGNEAWLRLGEKLKVSELIYPLLMVSSNDSSEALALSYEKGRKEFIKEMNTWVNSIGAYRTYFYDPSGLSARNISTAKDLSIITKWILQNEPEIFETTLLKSKTIRTHTWTNPTHFLNLDSYAGGKNGYTPEANRTSIALFKLGKQKKLYGVILLGSSARDADILDLLEETLR